MRTINPHGATGDRIAALAASRVGGTYKLGVPVDKSDPTATTFDCSELVAWAIFQDSHRLYGCSDNAGDPRTVDAFTGYLMRDAATIGLQVRTDVAAGIAGAILVREPTPGAMGHAAICTGTGGTYEAMGSAYGIVQGKARGRVWTIGVLVPWVQYRVGRPVDLMSASADASIWPRRGETSARVGVLQRALAAQGLDPGPPDNVYGTRTHAAVVLFQRFSGLVVDGLVGPATRQALGLA